MAIDETTYRIKLTDGTVVLLRDFFYANHASFSMFASRYLSDKEEIEDVVQDSFISFWEKDKVFPNITSIKAYFYTTIRNSCLDILKHDKVRKKFLAKETYGVDTNEYFLDGVLKQEVYTYVHQQIGKLSDKEKQVILLSMKGSSNNEIAEALGIQLNTVKTHKQRAYKILRENIGKFIFLIQQYI